MFDKNKNFYQNEKSLKDRYYLLRLGIYETLELEPNKTIYKSLVSFPSFLFINCLSSYILIKRNRTLIRFTLEKKLKLIGKLILLTCFNYNVFNRRYIDEYPVNKNFYIENKLTRLMNSLVNPVFVMEKDFLILFLILIPCLIFNRNKVDEMNKIKKEKIRQNEEDYLRKNNKLEIIKNTEKNKFIQSTPELKSVTDIEKVNQPVRILDESESNKVVRGGRFL